jgi:hypothetical protein
MTDSSDAKADDQPRDVQVVTVGLGSPYPPELIDPVHAATSTRKVFRLVPESELNDPDAERKSYRRTLVILLQERLWTRRLLECPPFRGLAGNQVKDVRSEDPKTKKRIPKNRQIQPCPERRWLLRNLVGALMLWDSAQASATLLASFRRHQEQVLAALDPALDAHEAWLWKLRRLGMVSKEGQPISLRPFLKAKQDLHNAISNPQPVPGAQTSQRLPGMSSHPEHPVTLHTVTIETVQRMFEDFLAFGPQTFSREAIYAALAAILNQLGVPSIQGKCFTAAGIKRLLAQHPPPYFMRVNRRDRRRNRRHGDN